MRDARLDDLRVRIEAAMRRNGISVEDVRWRLHYERTRNAIATARICNAAIAGARQLGPNYLRSYARAVAISAGGNFS